MIEAVQLVATEAKRAACKFAPFNSSHEFYGVLAEEVHECMLALHANDLDALMAEAIQVAAVCTRFVHERRSAGGERAA